MNKKDVTFNLIEFQMWCKYTKKFDYDIRWATDEVVEEMRSQDIAAFYVPQIKAVVLNPYDVQMGQFLHEAGHAYDFIVKEQADSNTTVAKETNAFYYGYYLAKEYIKKYPHYEWYVDDMLLEMVGHAHFGSSIAHSLAAYKAIGRLCEDGLLTKGEVEAMKTSVLKTQLEAALADYNYERSVQ